MKTVGIAGGNGFVGKHLAHLLASNGYHVIIFSRSVHSAAGNIKYAQWNPAIKTIDSSALADIDVMINLAGAGVMDKRWTAAYKQEIISSRTDAGYFLIEQLRAHAPNCKTYIASSATGIYGPDRPGIIPFTEENPPYNDFLANVCEAWEATTRSAARTYRTVTLRFGIVLGKSDGAYKEFAAPMRFGVMPVLGGGRQMVSWVHIDDVTGMLQYALENDSLHGTFNCVAPNVVSHKALMETIAEVKGGLKIPVPVPSFILKIMLGEASVEVLKSCTASAEKIISSGFSFKYPALETAIEALEQ